MAILWRIELLGGLRADRVNAQPLENSLPAPSLDHFRSRRAGALLAFLAYFPRPHAREKLIEILWPEHDPQRSRNHLRVLLAGLRPLLEPPDVPAGSVLIADRVSIGLNPQGFTTDVAQFESALQRVSQAEQKAALKQAVESYRGALLPGFYESWIVPEAHRLEESYFAALRRLISLLEREGDLQSALAYARRGAGINALREDVVRDVMRLYAATGQSALALRHYRELERELERELKISPDLQTRALENQIRTEAPDALEKSEKSATLRAAPPTIPVHSHAQTSRRTPTNARGASLPPQWTRFFGRTAEIEALQRLWSDHSTKMVTLIGPGGSGKTRLALESAYLWQEQWQSEITLWFAALAEVSQPENLVATLAEIVESAAFWPNSGPNGELERLVAGLQEPAQPVLVLDNLEQLLPAAAATIQILLNRVPTLRILATSRIPTQIVAETVFPVPMLAVPTPETPAEKLLECASARLFHDRARLVRPDFKISQHNARAVATLCAQLEGWPLAIEFCAARAQQLAPWQMVQRLQNRLDFLETSDPNAPARHSTLRATLEWSYKLLWPQLRQFFVALSVFSSGATPQAIAFVTQQPHAAHFLQQLYAASLVNLDEKERFSWLETVREFAAEQLSKEAQWKLRQRHAHYFRELIEAAQADLNAIESQIRLDCLKRLQVERENFRAALEWSLEHDPIAALHLVNGTGALVELLTEPRNLAERALEKAAHMAPPALLAEVLSIAATSAGRYGDFRRQRALNWQRLDLALQMDDEISLGWAWFHCACPAYSLGDWEEAETAFFKALQIFRAAVNNSPSESLNFAQQNVAWTLNSLGLCALECDNCDAAQNYFVESGEIFQNIGDRDGEAGALAQRGDLARRSGDLIGARLLLEQSEAIARALGDLRAHPSRRMQWGRLLWAENRPADARQCFERALDSFHEVKEFNVLLSAILALACLEAAQQPVRAATLLTFEAKERQESGLALWADWQQARQKAVETVRSILSETDWQSAQNRGNSLKMEEAVKLAKTEIEQKNGQ